MAEILPIQHYIINQSINSSSKTYIHVKKIVYGGINFCVPIKKGIKVLRVTLNKNDVVKYYGNKRRLRRMTIPYVLCI